MKKLSILLVLLAAMFWEGKAEAGICGRRGGQASNSHRSYSRQPTQPFPFNSRSDPRDWQEAHRGYGIKIRGW
jgi:hypothetical protein